MRLSYSVPALAVVLACGLAPGATVKLTIISKGAEKTVTFDLGELPRAQKQARAKSDDGDSSGTQVPRLGLSLAPAGNVAGGGNEGVVVTQVEADGPGAAQGFRTGDIILDVAGKKVASPEDVRKAFADARNALAAHTESADSLRLAQQRSAALTRASELMLLRFNGGEASRLDQIEAERAAFTALAQLADARRAMVVAQAALFRALGGGWTAPGSP